jgi:hypothetical protein
MMDRDHGAAPAHLIVAVGSRLASPDPGLLRRRRRNGTQPAGERRGPERRVGAQAERRPRARRRRRRQRSLQTGASLESRAAPGNRPQTDTRRRNRNRKHGRRWAW